MASALPAAVVSELTADQLERELGVLAALLHACVHAGASVGFILPCPLTECEGFWRKVLAAMRDGSRVLLVARLDGRIVGTVQLDHDTPANQPHRAEVRKLLVHPEFRRRGISRALMLALERRAAALGRHLLTLDTRTGDAAEPLYAGLGYETAGVIPGYCLDPAEDRLDGTTIMYKTLHRGAP